jgi:hypothetical protein
MKIVSKVSLNLQICDFGLLLQYKDAPLSVKYQITIANDRWLVQHLLTFPARETSRNILHENFFIFSELFDHKNSMIFLI